MFANERQKIILEMVKTNGAVTTSKLIKPFNVSIETIRRDLLSMEKQGLLTRVHGGAIEKNSMKAYNMLNERNKDNIDEKKKLSYKAMEFINEGDIIGVDAGSTAIIFANILKEKFNNLKIITHSLDVFNILSGYKNFELILCGGYFLCDENAFCGNLTIDMLSTLNIPKTFVFPSAVSLEYGICDYHKDLCPIQKQLVKSSDNIYILADSSKFEKRALIKLDDMRSSYTYITDNNFPYELIDIYKENGMKIYIGD